jgi:enoyl-CoA hydratase
MVDRLGRNPTYSYELIKTEMDDKGILTVTLNRPEKRNGFIQAWHGELIEIWEKVNIDDRVRCVIFTGAGKAFCAGGDVGAFPAVKLDPMQKTLNWLRDVKTTVTRIMECDKPIIAKVNGAAVGLGSSLVAACDVSFISDQAVIGDTHVKFGLVAADGGSALWGLLMGVNRQKEYLWSGELMSGQKAAELGLCNHCVPAADLDRTVQEYAEMIAALPPRAVQWTKRAINAPLINQVSANFDAAVPLEVMSAQTEDHLEAASAFREKRKGIYKGR